MNFLLFFAATFNLRSTILQLLAIVILLILFIQEQSADSLNGIMPVMTRSKSLLLTQSTTGPSKVSSLSTSSSIEPLGAINLSTNSSIEFSTVTLTSKQLSSEFYSTGATSSFSSPPPAPNIDIATNHTTARFRNFNFQYSKFQNSSVSTTTADPILNCHNFTTEVKEIMESDCEDDDRKVSPTMVDITKLITSLSQQISNQSNFIQDQLLKQQSIIEHQAHNDLKLQDVLQSNEVFKQEVKLELENLRNFLVPPKINTTPSPPPTIPPRVQPDPPVNSGIQAPGPVDSNQQVMLMLAESFSKLSLMVIQDKSSETKYDWPKFSGETKTFKAWYLAILVQLSLPQWQDLYDPSTKDIVKSTTNVALNGKLYAKLITCLDGSALQSIVARTHLHSDGLSVLQNLYQTHHPLHIPEIIAAKTVQFWGNIKRMPNESVDACYNRFKELFDEI